MRIQISESDLDNMCMYSYTSQGGIRFENQMYIGMRQARDTVQAFLSAVKDTKQKYIIRIDGEPRCGKTTLGSHILPFLMQKQARDLGVNPSNNERLHVRYLNLEPLSGVDTFHQKIAKFYNLSCDIFSRQKEEPPNPSVAEEWYKTEILNLYRKQPHTMLCLDEFHHIYSSMTDAEMEKMANFMHPLLTDLSHKCYFIVTGKRYMMQKYLKVSRYIKVKIQNEKPKKGELTVAPPQVVIPKEERQAKEAAEREKEKQAKLAEKEAKERERRDRIEEEKRQRQEREERMQAAKEERQKRLEARRKRREGLTTETEEEQQQAKEDEEADKAAEAEQQALEAKRAEELRLQREEEQRRLEEQERQEKEKMLKEQQQQDKKAQQEKDREAEVLQKLAAYREAERQKKEHQKQKQRELEEKEKERQRLWRQQMASGKSGGSTTKTKSAGW
jgi:hypothetical protein